MGFVGPQPNATPVIAAALGLLACVVGADARQDAAPSRPNIVWIVADDQGWTDFGFMGHKIIQTPHLDKLAAEGAVFPNGYVPTSLCRASLATLLTGLYAHQHKICCNDPPAGLDRAAMHPFIKNAPTIPRLLAEAGYRSLQTGKYWEGHYAHAGFTHGMTTKGRHGDEGLIIGRQTMKPIFDFIAAERDKPFFLWYAPMMPHEPHNPPERLLKKYAVEGRNLKLARYYAMCEWFDETCGELFDYLDKNGLKENTLVAFVVDNGWIQETGEVRTTRGWFAPRSKMSPYDGGVRTPIILSWPGRTKAGRYEDLVSTVDLAPTTLSAAGVKPSVELPGLSMLDTAAGQGPLPRSAVFGEIYLHTSADIDRPELSLTHQWVREKNWKLILHHDEPKSELYDLSVDPHEEQNLAAKHPQRVGRLAEAVERVLWQGAEPTTPLTVMTYNLRYASPRPPNAWPERRPVMKELLARQAPDLIGTQEGLYEQLKDIAEDLPGHEWIGLGRDGGSRGEFMAVFYRRERLEPLEWDHFWLSDTPQTIGSKTWGNIYPRMVTWVRFRDRASKQEFYCFNTHFDHMSQPSREKSAELIRERIAGLKTALPVLLIGDFNAAAGKNKAYDILVGPERFADTWTAAAERGKEAGTFHDFRGPTPNGPRIDWILTQGHVAALATEIDTFAKDGQYPSDHFPVVCRLRFTTPKQDKPKP